MLAFFFIWFLGLYLEVLKAGSKTSGSEVTLGGTQETRYSPEDKTSYGKASTLTSAFSFSLWPSMLAVSVLVVMLVAELN